MKRERSLSFLWHSIHAGLVGVLVVVTAIGWHWSWKHRAAEIEVRLV